MSRRLFIAVLAVVTVIPMTAGAAGGQFTDDENSVHEADIEALFAAGITRGCNPPDNDRFCPDDPVTRAQMASFLVRALELPGASGSDFTDIAGSVHAGDIEALAQAGVTRGCNPPDNTRFCPDDPVTREQMASFLVRGFGLAAASGSDFTDIAGSVHAGDIEALAQAGITRGCNPPDNTMYCPGDPVTRAQMASFLIRAISGGDGGDPGDPPPDDPEPPSDPASGTLRVHFPALASGDAAIYLAECGEAGLIDAGAGQATAIFADLETLGVDHFEWAIATHYDSDAFGDIRELNVDHGISYGAVYDRGGEPTRMSNSWNVYLPWVTENNLRQQASIGQVLTLCDGAEQVSFEIVSVGIDGTAAGGLQVTNENDKGICVHIEFGSFDMASCGDIHGDAGPSDHVDVESEVAPTIGDVEVVKINKHGSRHSSNAIWIDRLSPEAGILTPSIPEGEAGIYPHEEILQRWQDAGTVLYGNNTQFPEPNDGWVTIRTNGNDSFSVETELGRNDSYGLDEN